jgi:hypothetical protein
MLCVTDAMIWILRIPSGEGRQERARTRLGSVKPRLRTLFRTQSVDDRSCTPHSLLPFVWMEQRKARDSLSVRLLILSATIAMADSEVV